MLCLSFPLSDKLTLPMEVILTIFQYCSAEDLAKLSLVSKDFLVLASDESLWNILFTKKFSNISEKDKLKKKLDEMCCSKHRYALMENEERRKERIAKSITIVQQADVKQVADIRKGDLLVIRGKCCKIIEVSVCK